MLAQAAHLVDAVVPAVRLRDCVLSFGFELSLLAAESPKVLRAIARINYELTARYFQRRAAESVTVGKTHAGAITYRFGSSLNLHLHLHVRVLDGVFVERDNEALRLCTAQALGRDELCELLETVAARVAKWFRKHGVARDEPDSDSNETHVFTFDEMLAQLAAGRGAFERVRNCHYDGPAISTETNPRPPSCDGAVTFCGFHLHALVCIAGADGRGRERRCRAVYACAVFDRLRLLPDGCYGYSLKKSGRRACRGRIMTSLECLASPSDRASPPARSASILFGQAATWQQRIRRTLKCVQQVDVQLAIGPADARSCGESKGDLSSVSPAMAFGSIGRREESAACATGQALPQLDSSPSHHACCKTHPTGHRSIGACAITAVLLGAAEVVESHSVLSVAHGDRTRRGLPYAATSSVPWAILHARTDRRIENGELRMENAELRTQN